MPGSLPKPGVLVLVSERVSVIIPPITAISPSDKIKFVVISFLVILEDLMINPLSH